MSDGAGCTTGRSPVSAFNERPEHAAAELAIAKMDPRPGYLTTPELPLSQDETNAAIRYELWVIHGPIVVNVLGTAPSPVRLQRGGLDEDELIRLLAFRTWGRRDIDWMPAYPRSPAPGWPTGAIRSALMDRR